MKPERPKQIPPTKHYYFTWEPVYERYREVKVIDRCDCCDHKIGSHIEKRGVKLIGWKSVRRKKNMFYGLNKVMEEKILDQIFTPSPIVAKWAQMETTKKK